MHVLIRICRWSPLMVENTVGSGLSDDICSPQMCQINQVLGKPGVG